MGTVVGCSLMNEDEGTKETKSLGLGDKKIVS